MSNFSCINGTYVPASAAMIPVSDRLVRFGDGLFETIRIEQSVPYQWELHLSRLSAGLAALRISAPNVDWKHSVREMIAKNVIVNGFIRITISRGIGSRGYTPDATIEPNWIMEYLPDVPTPTGPLKLWLSTITRPPLSSLPGNHKLAHGIGSTLALLEARDHGADEAVMLTFDGKLCETASANLFWIANGKVYTPALATGCLAGTTRDAVMRLISVEEVEVGSGSLHNADAIFLTNARLGAWPAISSKFKVTDSHEHYVLADLRKALQADRTAYIATHRVDWVAA